jgi:Electron transfer DM13
VRRLLGNRVAVGCAVAVGTAAFVAGLLVARGGDAATAAGQAGVLAAADFTSGEWGTHGRAAIVRGADGSLKLRFTRFQTQKAPELWVLLEPENGVGDKRQLARLQHPWGSQEYDLPSELARNPLQRVIIFCAKCNKVWGSARLQRVHA